MKKAILIQDWSFLSKPYFTIFAGFEGNYLHTKLLYTQLCIKNMSTKDELLQLFDTARKKFEKEHNVLFDIKNINNILEAINKLDEYRI